MIDSGFTPQQAWQYWLQLQALSDAIWDAYQQPFVQFCIEDLNADHYLQQHHDQPFIDSDDDIPF